MMLMKKKMMMMLMMIKQQAFTDAKTQPPSNAYVFAFVQVLSTSKNVYSTTWLSFGRFNKQLYEPDDERPCVFSSSWSLDKYRQFIKMINYIITASFLSLCYIIWCNLFHNSLPFEFIRLWKEKTTFISFRPI